MNTSMFKRLPEVAAIDKLISDLIHIRGLKIVNREHNKLKIAEDREKPVIGAHEISIECQVMGSTFNNVLVHFIVSLDDGLKHQDITCNDQEDLMKLLRKIFPNQE